ncbi:MAG: bifunctional UDP-sugar hydrolase/5'-nucleotidase [Anaerolineae bacterium]|nr:bifunctional UDP-sugar hydrolase/5'-nucleotidase [Anaerolineae bacterium]
MITFLILLVAIAACTPPTNDVVGTADPTTSFSQLVNLTILYTNDEHGWMSGEDNHGGAATIMQLWEEEEGYIPDGPFLILSGGDTFTGPAISSWFDGESMVEVMNEMGYDAAAVGNHEFDYGIEGLEQRSAQAAFPYLSANIVSSQTGTGADFVLPYVIQEVNGINVGIIGLSSRATPRTTMPTYVSGLDFTPYTQALNESVPRIKAEGAQVIVVISHLCSYELLALAPHAAKLNISMIGGGHCHERFDQVLEGVALIEAGSNLRAYGRIDIEYDPSQDIVNHISAAVKSNKLGQTDPEVAALVAKWQDRIDAELKHVIGYTKIGVNQASSSMYNMVMDAWLAYYPADAAISNPGGFRQDLSPGDITLADVVGVLPFDNYLIDVELTGGQLIESLKHGSRQPAIGGVSTKGGYSFLDGSPIDQDAVYHVLVNNFMYAGGDGYTFSDYDPDAYETGIDWRQPVIDWIIEQKSSIEQPLENFIDSVPR